MRTTIGAALALGVRLLPPSRLSCSFNTNRSDHLHDDYRTGMSHSPADHLKASPSLGVYDPSESLGSLVRGGVLEPVILFEEVAARIRAADTLGIASGDATLALLAKEQFLDALDAVVLLIEPGDPQAVSMCTGAVRRLVADQLAYVEIVSHEIDDVRRLLSLTDVLERAELVLLEATHRLALSGQFAPDVLAPRVADARSAMRRLDAND